MMSKPVASDRSEAAPDTEAPASGELPESFSLVAGGALHGFLGRLGLLESDSLPSRSAALGLALAAFLVPAAFALLQSLLDARFSGWDYFSDPTVYARYLVAIIVMISTERLADARIILMTRYFSDAELISAEDRGRFAAAISRADRRASSVTGELLILFVALLLSVVATRYAALATADTWEGMTTITGEVTLSWAGEASAVSSNAFFLFLVLRWFWRFYLWAALLRVAAGLRLQIMPLHPDRCGGLGFLAIFPSIFSGLVFALSCVIAASFHKALPLMGDSAQLIWLAMASWMVLMTAVFLGPLLVFTPSLYTAREKAVLQYGRLAHGHHLAFHRRWIRKDVGGEEILGSADPSSASDLNASVDTVISMRMFPIDRNAIVLLLASAGVPFLVVAALQMPIADLVALFVGILL